MDWRVWLDGDDAPSTEVVVACPSLAPSPSDSPLEWTVGVDCFLFPSPSPSSPSRAPVHPVAEEDQRWVEEGHTPQNLDRSLAWEVEMEDNLDARIPVVALTGDARVLSGPLEDESQVVRQVEAGSNVRAEVDNILLMVGGTPRMGQGEVAWVIRVEDHDSEDTDG